MTVTVISGTESLSQQCARLLCLVGCIKIVEILQALSPALFSRMSKDHVTHKFTQCARKVGLKGIKLHSLRHTFGTFLIGMGYDITVVKELLGHEDIKTTMVYAKADSRLLRDAIRSFELLEKSGYKMVTRPEEPQPGMLGTKTASE